MWTRQWRRLGDTRKLVIGALTGAALAALLTIQLMPDKVSLRVNQIAPEDVIAHRYVQYLDEAATQRLRAQAQANVPKQYANDQNAPAESEREVRRLQLEGVVAKRRNSLVTIWSGINHLSPCESLFWTATL